MSWSAILFDIRPAEVRDGGVRDGERVSEVDATTSTMRGTSGCGRKRTL